MSQPKAYSYLRFSSPEQAKGDSFRRQSELSRRYAAQHKLTLDDNLTFRDLGMSAFRGKNATEGALGDFVRAVEAGRVARGSYLLVENLDRLSRDAVPTAFRRFSEILEHGVNVVTLTDGKLYTRASLSENFGDLMLSLTTMYRAHEESALKSRRIKASWKAKRSRAQESGEKLTALCPGWLRLKPSKDGFEVIKERASIVRRIFEMTLDGNGKGAIARTFNSEKIPSFGKTSGGWHASYIQKVLESDATYGTYQPMRLDVVGRQRKRVAEGEPIPNYFPPVIERKTFLAAQRARTERRIAPGRKGEKFSNLFTGIAVCGNCGGQMHYINKGKPPKGGAYLVCSNARRRSSNCHAPGWRYIPFEKFVLIGLDGVNYEELFPLQDKQSRAALKELEAKRLEQEEDLRKVEVQLQGATDALIALPGQTSLQQRLVQLQERRDGCAAALAQTNASLDNERDRLANVKQDRAETEEVMSRLADAHRGTRKAVYDLRTRLHQLLRRSLDRLVLKQADGLHGIAEVYFKGVKTVSYLIAVERGQRAASASKMLKGKRTGKRMAIEVGFGPR